MNKFLKYHLPALLFAGLIIGLSSIQNVKFRPVRMIAFDKIVHFIEYSIFAFLAFRSVSNISNRLNLNKSLLLSVLVVSLFAWGDETYQRFVPGRQFDVYDLLTDVLGSILVMTFLWFRSKRKNESITLDKA